jgi:hypothetical protein
VPGDINVKVEGGAQLRRALRRTEPEVDKALAAELRDVADAIRDEAAAGAPRLTGDLAASLRVSVQAKRVSIYSRLPQAGVLHWGGTIEPRGVPITFPRTEFITRVVEVRSARIMEGVGDAFEDAARKAGWLT